MIISVTPESIVMDLKYKNWKGTTEDGCTQILVSRTHGRGWLIWIWVIILMLNRAFASVSYRFIGHGKHHCTTAFIDVVSDVFSMTPIVQLRDWQARDFYRDMALGGPYFSRFLLNVIFAHACRHMPENDHRFAAFDRGETFLRDAMLLLIEEMKQSKPRIPTIQGLLILGGRQCAVGQSSEGWLYTGMVGVLQLMFYFPICADMPKAIRMINDLGLHIKRSQDSLMKEFEPDDLEIRKRLYLSVYAWDK